MLEAKWLDAEGGGRALFKPVTSGQMWNLGATPVHEWGEPMMAVFLANAVDFEGMRTMDGRVISKADIAPREFRSICNTLSPADVYSVVNQAVELATLSEDERKNYSPQRTSPDTPSTSVADPALAPTAGSPADSPTD